MDHPRKILIQMSGCPGSGKSTMANLLGQSINGVVIDHDLIRSFFLDNDMFFEQAARLAYRFQWVLAEDTIKRERNVIVDSTCNYDETLNKGIMLARKYGFNYRYVECRVHDIELLDRRLRNRVPLRSQRTGVSLPPTDANDVRHNEDFQTLFKRWIEHPCRPDRNAIVVDSSTEPEQCLEYILKQIVPSIGVQTSNSATSNSRPHDQN
jgi:predicted kinase